MTSGDFLTIGSAAAVFVVVVALAGISTYIRRAFAHHRVEQYVDDMAKTALEVGDKLLDSVDLARAGQIAETVGKLRARNNEDLAEAVEALGDNELAWRKQALELRQGELRRRLESERAKATALVPFVAEMLLSALFFGLSALITFLAAAFTMSRLH